LPSFANTSSVSKEETGAGTVGQKVLVALACVLDPFELQDGQLSIGNDVDRDAVLEGKCRLREGNKSKPVGLGDVARMF
jgi:hypothetical protein